MFWYDRSQKPLFFRIKHMVSHLMFDEFLSPHYTFLAYTAISCSSQLFTTFYEFIDVKYHFEYFLHNIDGDFVPIIFNSPVIWAKDLILVQTCFSIGKIIFCSLLIMIYLTLSTWTSSWSLVRWPLRFASSSHSLQV